MDPPLPLWTGYLFVSKMVKLIIRGSESISFFVKHWAWECEFISKAKRFKWLNWLSEAQNSVILVKHCAWECEFISIAKGFKRVWYFRTFFSSDWGFTLYRIETHFPTFANRADPDQTAESGSFAATAWSWSSLFVYGNMIYLIIN